MKKCLLLLAMSVLAFSCKSEAEKEPEYEKVGYINLKAFYQGFENAFPRGVVHIVRDRDTIFSYDYGGLEGGNLKFPSGDNYVVHMENVDEGWTVKSSSFLIETFKTSEVKLECPLVTAAMAVSYDINRFKTKYSDYEIEFKNSAGQKRMFYKADYDRVIGICNHYTASLSFNYAGALNNFYVTLRATRLDGTIETLEREFPVTLGRLHFFSIAFDTADNLDVTLSSTIPYGVDY